MSIELKMVEETGLISFTVFEKNRVMDFIIPARLKHLDISAHLSYILVEVAKL